MFSGAFPIFALSNHTAFSQTQTGATVPLKVESMSFQKKLIAKTLKSVNFLNLPQKWKSVKNLAIIN